MNHEKTLFPTIRERGEILAEINQKPTLSEKFNRLLRSEQELFLDICSGARGTRILSDPFFKEIMNPEYTPERLERFLSCILGRQIKILQVLPNDSVRIASEATLLITDVVVELEDGSIANIEVQRIGYKFPGERAACYSADMLLRQYKRVREARGKKFIYKDVKPVYTIVLFEKSPAEFHIFPDNYIHYIEPRSDTGIELNLLQKFVFVSLDIFKKRRHNETIKDELDAWLTFFSSDHPLRIEHLLNTYPYFISLYNDICNLCMNTERMMELFSKELQMIDENTVQYMMDEMQEQMDEMQEQIVKMNAEFEKKATELAEKATELAEKSTELAAKDDELAEKTNALAEKDNALAEKDNALAEKDRLIRRLQEQLQIK